MCEGATYGKVVPSRPSLLRSASWLQSLKCFAKKLKVSSFKTSAGASGRRTSERGASGRRLRAAQRHSCAKSVDAYGKAVPLCPSYLRSANCPKSSNCYPDFEVPKAYAHPRRRAKFAEQWQKVLLIRKITCIIVIVKTALRALLCRMPDTGDAPTFL